MSKIFEVFNKNNDIEYTDISGYRYFESGSSYYKLDLKNDTLSVSFKKNKHKINADDITIYCIKIDGEIRYIGQTSNYKSRIYCHESNCRNINNKKSIYQLMRLHDYEFEVIDIVPCDKGIDMETYYMNKYEEQGLIILGRSKQNKIKI